MVEDFLSNVPKEVYFDTGNVLDRIRTILADD